MFLTDVFVTSHSTRIGTVSFEYKWRDFIPIRNMTAASYSLPDIQFERKTVTTKILKVCQNVVSLHLKSRCLLPVYTAATPYHVAQQCKNVSVDLITHYNLLVTYLCWFILYYLRLQILQHSLSAHFFSYVYQYPFLTDFVPLRPDGFILGVKVCKTKLDQVMTTRAWRAQDIYRTVPTEHNDSQIFTAARTEECTAIANPPCSTAKQFQSPGQRVKKYLQA